MKDFSIDLPGIMARAAEADVSPLRQFLFDNPAQPLVATGSGGLKFCLMTKYAQSEAFRDELARTGDRFIVEMQSNTLRPANTYNAKRSDDGQTWSGPNLMGRLLMELRDKGRLEYSLPDEVMRFPDLR